MQTVIKPVWRNGIRACLKNTSRKGCGFESHHRHSLSPHVYGSLPRACIPGPASIVFAKNPRLSVRSPVKFPVSRNRVDISCRVEIDGPLSLADNEEPMMRSYNFSSWAPFHMRRTLLLEVKYFSPTSTRYPPRRIDTQMSLLRQYGFLIKETALAR
jgi:hypothetical protein